MTYLMTGFGGVGIVSQDEQSRSPALVRAPRTRVTGVGGGGSAWKFAVVDPDFVPSLEPSSPQASVRVSVLGATRASLSEGAVQVVDAEQPAGTRIFHKSELVGVRQVEGEWRVAKLYTVPALMGVVEVGDVWARGFRLFPSINAITWHDDALDLREVLVALGGSFPAGTYEVFATLNSTDAAWSGRVEIGWERYSASGKDLAWPFLPDNGQIVSSIASTGGTVVGSTRSGSFAYPSGASTGLIEGNKNVP